MRLLVLLAGLSLAAPAHAQSNGNVYNGTSHEPAPGDVLDKERAAGVAPPAQVQQRRDEDVEQLRDQLLRQSGQPRPTESPQPAGVPAR